MRGILESVQLDRLAALAQRSNIEENLRVGQVAYTCCAIFF